MQPTKAASFNHLSNDELETQLTQHATNLNAANYQLLMMIAEFDRRQAWGHEGVRSCAHWLNLRCGIAICAAREKLRVGLALASLPNTCVAFASGELSYSKARAITRVATPENEDCLLSYARYGSASQVERVVRLYRRQYLDANAKTTNYNLVALPASEDDEVSPAEAERQGANHRNNYRLLDTRWDEDGCLLIRARLTPEQGAVVLKAIEAAVDSMPKSELDDSAETAPKNSAESNVMEISHHVRHRGNRRADALVMMAESLLQNLTTTSSNADRFQVVVHIDKQVLAKEIHTTLNGEPDH